MASKVATAPARIRRKVATRLGRSDRSAFGLWFWEIDRVLLLLGLVLISIGLIAVAAGVALLRFHAGLLPVLAASALAGLVLAG